jgi:WD40 repeat protein
MLPIGDLSETARLFDVATGQPLGPALPHRGRINRIAFRPDGRLIATASSDPPVRLWHLPEPVAGSLEEVSHWLASRSNHP